MRRRPVRVLEEPCRRAKTSDPASGTHSDVSSTIPSCAVPGAVDALNEPASSQDAIWVRNRSKLRMARRFVPLTVLTGIFAALGTGFLVLLFGRDSFAAVLVMLAWMCTLCFLIYLLILAVSLFIRALSHLLRGGGQ